jgi:glycosyltransferase involved in cell wall biosynthesis
MLDWYNSGTVLVCASESEGTPNPALEAAACGCTIVTTRVGNMPELISDGVNGVFVERDLDSLERGVRCAIANYVPMATRLLADIQSWQWPRRAPAFFSVFQDMLARAGRTGGADDFRDSGKVISTAMPVSEPPPPNTTRA